MTGMRSSSFLSSAIERLLREPLLHFFLLGGVLFAAERFQGGDQRVIVMNPGVQSEVARRFEDQRGRPATPEELKQALAEWRTEEVLFREAIRRGLTRDDSTIRTVLADKLRGLVERQVNVPEPTPEELARYRLEHRGRYETPLRYEFQYLSFSKLEPDFEKERGRVRRALSQGVDPSKLGRPLRRANLTEDVIRDRLGEGAAQRIPRLKPGPWTAIDGEKELQLVRLQGRSGGLPGPEELGEQLKSDWTQAERKRELERLLGELVDSYRFESEP